MQSNRYLIFGLVNTFFHEKYEVSAEGNKYRGETFFITKNKKPTFFSKNCKYQ